VCKPSLLALLMSLWLLQSCTGQPADLKCSLVPCTMEPPATLTASQQQGWHDCMAKKHQSFIALTTGAMQQQDYDDCVSEAKGTPSTAASPNPVHP
jgi:hypothetical protein